MTTLTEEEMLGTVEELARKSEILLEEDECRKDLKKLRNIIKRNLYDGSKKLKHLVPKGKQL